MKNILSITIATFLVFTAAPEATAGSVKLDWLIKKLKACRWDKHCWDDPPAPPAPPPSPAPCVPVCSPDGQWCKTCDGGAVDPFDLPITGNGIIVLDVQADGSETMIFRGHGWHAEVGDDAIAWCMEGADATGAATSTCGMDPLPTTFGCQYFPEEGPADDLMVCILTLLDGMCGGCISGCQGDECGEEE